MKEILALVVSALIIGLLLFLLVVDMVSTPYRACKGKDATATALECKYDR